MNGYVMNMSTMWMHMTLKKVMILLNGLKQ
jgi:hypothetical protein